MFTGIVEEIGTVVAVQEQGDCQRLTVRGPTVTSDLRSGDSISVNGVCLTATELADGTFTADVMAETLRRSTLGRLEVGARVNLERAATLSSRLGGHLVQGHVDGVGTIVAREPGEHWETVELILPAGLTRYVVEKGSITVDGISLTVASVGPAGFTVGLIPATLRGTTLGDAPLGHRVNLEVDVVAKYVERLLASGALPVGTAGSDPVARLEPAGERA